MKKFEYKVDQVETHSDFGFRRYSGGEDKFLREKGNSGWELIGVVSEGPLTNLDKTTYYFKREITQ